MLTLIWDSKLDRNLEGEESLVGKVLAGGTSPSAKTIEVLKRKFKNYDSLKVIESKEFVLVQEGSHQRIYLKE